MHVVYIQTCKKNTHGHEIKIDKSSLKTLRKLQNYLTLATDMRAKTGSWDLHGMALFHTPSLFSLGCYHGSCYSTDYRSYSVGECLRFLFLVPLSHAFRKDFSVSPDACSRGYHSSALVLFSLVNTAMHLPFSSMLKQTPFTAGSHQEGLSTFSSSCSKHRMPSAFILGP